MKTISDFFTERKKEVMETTIQNNGKKNVKYRCPMKCRGEEVYNEPGLCPDSKMQMIPVGAGHIFY